MRVWDGADPRLLNRKHLLAEHREIHALLNWDFPWGTNPEARRFIDLGDRGRSLLVLRHELLRVGMAVRWGVGRHGRDMHGTPADTDELSPRAAKALLLYEREALPLGPGRSPVQADAFFRRLMAPMHWPLCYLEGGANTPWDRDGISMREYVKVGDGWKRARYHHKADTTEGHS